LAEPLLEGQASAASMASPAPAKRPGARFVVQVEEGLPHGGLYELEQTTIHRVVDTRTGEVVLSFVGELSATLSRDTGMWDDVQLSGVREVVVAPDSFSLLVRTHDGREETVPLPMLP
jgi:hypothetical protein